MPDAKSAADKRNRKAAAASLPPFPWQTESAGRPLARRPVERAQIVEEQVADDGEIVERRESVWRVGSPRILGAMTCDRRHALETYAATVERIGASGGTVDPTSAGRSGAPACGPSVAKLAAVEWVATADSRIARVGLGVGTGCNGRDLARWIAVDGLSGVAVLRRLGVERPTRRVSSRLARALFAVADILAECCASSRGSPVAENHATPRQAGV
ncbi:hypothetical protein [Tropicimonas sp. IMCC34043]|uniref:hypothetical protein n=1 Tax=Tropicimonas sp. IMCC34043 TaxID=2248760 RepID=UPI001300B9DC|nr:hypothetical protein [Tropicimonas sp. IMCC34043]